MEQVSFIDGVIEGLRKLVGKGYKLVMVTNQTFLGTPRHPQKIFDQVMDKMSAELEKYGVHFAFVMVCPHGPDEKCECRKPKIDGLEQFLKNHPVDLASSLMFGDRATDRQFAENLRVRFVQIETNKQFKVPSDI